MIPQHLSITNEHYSPAHVVEAGRSVLGGFDLDPASCAVANETIRATRYIAQPDDGLTHEWSGRVWLNPPGGAFKLSKKEIVDRGLSESAAKAEQRRLSEEAIRWGTKSRACAWWRKLTEEWEAGRVTEALFLGFTLELLRTTQNGGKWPHPFDFTICVPSDRLCFAGDDPTHANVIVYLGPRPERFKDEFFGIGRCK